VFLSLFLRVSRHVLRTKASRNFFIAPPASFFGGSLKEAQSSATPEMLTPGHTSASNKGCGNIKGKHESMHFHWGDETKQESALPLALIILGPCRGTVAALLCSLLSFLYLSIDGYGSKNQHVEEIQIQRKKV